MKEAGLISGLFYYKIMRKKTESKITNYLETFLFPDIPYQPYPVYSISEKGNLFNLRSILYPNPTSAKKFTRKKQLSHRSTQAKIFDALINVGYFDPLPCYREFPIIIQNHLRLSGQDGSYYLCDYFFPTLKDDKGHWGLSIELDSELHDPEKDILRDQYFEKIGILVFRIRNLERPDVQKGKFREVTGMMRTLENCGSPRVFSFLDNIHIGKGI